MITVVVPHGGCGGFVIPHWFFVTKVWLWFKELCKLLELVFDYFALVDASTWDTPTHIKLTITDVWCNSKGTNLDSLAPAIDTLVSDVEACNFFAEVWFVTVFLGHGLGCLVVDNEDHLDPCWMRQRVHLWS